jgi:uncharacterized protein (DUF1800 family)
MSTFSKKNTILGYRNAYHLLKRTLFCINTTLIEQYATKTPHEALSSLFQFSQLNSPTPLNSLGQTYIPTVNNPTITDTINFSSTHNHRYWWINQFMQDKTIQYKLSLFLHTRFIIGDSTSNYWVNFDYLELLNFHADGSLKELALRMTKNIGMLYYLDNRLNKKNAPNENYAREFLELFTIGKGDQIGTGNYTTYTEHDVQQAARIFTGFTGDVNDKFTRLNTFDPVTLIPEGYINVSNHDTGNKTFSAAFDNQTIIGGTDEASIQQELENFVTMVFNQMATAKSYARRIYRFFVSRNITTSIEQNIISPLAQTLYDNNYNLQVGITQLLCSQHFYDDEANNNIIGNLVKSPLELFIQLYTIFDVKLPNYNSQTKTMNMFYGYVLYPATTNLAFKLLEPQDVNGYAAYSDAPNYDKNWITASNLKNRYDLIIDKLLTGYSVNGFTIQLESAQFVKNSGHFSNPESSEQLLQDFFDLLFVSTPIEERYTYFEQALLGGLSAINWQVEWQDYVNTNDNNIAVTIALNNLIKALVKSPEFQVI